MLLGILIVELRVNSRSEILPTYRVGAPTVCAPTSSVGDTGSNSDLRLVDSTWGVSCVGLCRRNLVFMGVYGLLADLADA